MSDNNNNAKTMYEAVPAEKRPASPIYYTGRSLEDE